MQQHILHLIAGLDQLLSAQVTAILHQPRLQLLEARWRGLHYLLQQLPADMTQAKIKLLDLSWLELSKDVNRAIEFDQSELFRKIYNQEFGSPGGEPFGLLIGDYYFPDNTTDCGTSWETLQQLIKIAAAAFAPCLLAAAPQLLGLNSWTELAKPFDLSSLSQEAGYLPFKQIRRQEDARFLGLIMPRVLMREPYSATCHKFNYHETIHKLSDYLWGNPGFAFAARVLRTQLQQGWFTEMRGQARDLAEGGSIPDLGHDNYRLGAYFYDKKPALEVSINSLQEPQLNQFGLISLRTSQYGQQTVFYACPSLQTAKSASQSNTHLNYELASLLNYILSASRFAHYIKVIMRDRLGSFQTRSQCERYLQQWLHQYTAASKDISPTLRSKYPLKAAQVTVTEFPGQPGLLLCHLQLQPQDQYDYLETCLQFTTAITRV